ncbi:hypothetical protein BEP19_03075 [Ammoniphilus oxalaticus]|uniref:ATP-grasp domain-containing protein n=1 Tax=Ammoniphilus oxalaticus TaxID=66863 RepID=A0A419SNS1_9BACL|nr:YheC/YheD family protein [Ammoniphilus oxalaticus]RKD25925.1 hypothetical protein BEP19_03075 [Ammoniphilus oxalaticus]
MANSLGKLTKHKFLMMSKDLVSSLPHTQKMTKESFCSLLNRYGRIVVKPSSGSGGVGVMQIISMGKRRYAVHYGKYQKTIQGLLPTYQFAQSKAKGLYLAQQGIKLAKINGRPFDLRVMVQRKRNSEWVVTGILAKVAGSGFFITNIVESKGKALPLRTAVQQASIRRASYDKINQQIHRLALQTVYRLQKYYRIRTVGIDMGIDEQGKVWIIEANFSPDKTYFRRLKDKTMYRRIMSYYYGSR